MSWVVPKIGSKRTASVRLFAPIVFMLAATHGGLSSGAQTDRIVVSLDVLPAKVYIGGLNRQQQLLVTAKDKSGRKFDVTHRCQITVKETGFASVDGAVVRGVSDGTTSLVVRWQDIEQRIEVIVDGFDKFPSVHFRRDVIPLLSKLGCNNGGCHGKQSGQNGFKLSVFGFDAVADHNALTKEARGRRVFPADPENSLLILKATALSPHGGGRRLEPASVDYTLLTEWIRQGTPWGADDAADVVRLDVQPPERVMDMSSDQQILVTAIYEDGQRRDVTDAASYSGNADTVGKVDQRGRIRTGEIPGETAITINYRGHVAVVRILVPLPHAPSPYPDIATHNRIDKLVVDKLKKMGIVPSELADDATFLRRLYLDTIGMLPKPDEVRSFLADANVNKRRNAIDGVLDRPEMADYWALKWSDILLVDRQKLGERGAFEFHRWLREQIAANRPYDQWVRELITATGYSGKYGPVNFYRAMPTPEDATKSVSQALLGVRMDCAQCHHHPFDRWGQEDFYGMAGFFNGLERKAIGDKDELVYHAGHRGSKLPLTGKPVATRPPGGETIELAEHADPRVKLAAWVTDHNNPWFARLLANRLWKHFLGRGLVEPEDDLRSTNPATNEPLLAYLSEQVVETKFNVKAIMRLILNSRTYQLSSATNVTNRGDQQNFSHYHLKRLPAEVLLDAICEVTGSPEQFPGMPPGTRSVQLWDNRLPSYFLDTFGRSQRTSPCECGKSSEPTMSQALHLMNAPEIEAKITNPAGRVAKLLERRVSRDRIVDEICLAALGRPPHAKEKKIAAELFSQQPTRQAAEDFLWTLLNSYDFLFVH